MPGASVVDQNVEVAGFDERSVECLFDGKPVGQIESNRVASRHFWDASQIARRAPGLVTLRHK